MRNARTKHLDFIIGDIAALELAHGLVVILSQERVYGELYISYIQLGIMLAAITLSVAFFSDGYRGILYRGYLKEMEAVCSHMAITFAIEVVCLFAFRISGIFSRVVLFAAFFLGILFMYGERLLVKRYLVRKFRKIKYARTLMIIATQQQAGTLLECLSAHPFTVFHIQGLAVADRDLKGMKICGTTVSCTMDQVTEYVRSHIIDEVLISMPGKPEEEAKLAKQFLSIGVVVHIYMEQYLEEIPHKELERVNGMNVISCFNRVIPMHMLFCKRLMDILGGITGCVMALLIGVIVGPLIYIRSPGPILFSQIRVGKNGRKFRIYKFRSMVRDAEQQKEKLLSQNKVRGNMFKMDDDPRIIPGIGHFIRKTRLDEFPQFYNVLKGDMSLVGTRPPTVDEYESYSFAHKKRLAMKPGITGLWQISGRSDITDFEEVVKLDSQYIDEWNIEMDIKIILRTILVVMNRRGGV